MWLLLVFMLEAVLGLLAYVYQVSLSHCHANCSIIWWNILRLMSTLHTE